MQTYIDTHTHFYDSAFDSDRDEAIARSILSGVTRMIQPDVDSSERDLMWELSERYPGVLYNMVGLYPGSVQENWMEEVERMLPYGERNVVAVGEIGLDYHYSKDTAALQKEALRYQLEWAAGRNLPVNIHLREATEDFLEVLRDCAHLGIRGNMHAYAGSYETFLEISRLGDWYLGIGGVLTFKKSHLVEVVRKAPLKRLLLETDSPYLTPVPHRGERNESTYIPIIAEKIAEIKGVSVEDVARITTQSAEELFGI